MSKPIKWCATCAIGIAFLIAQPISLASSASEFQLGVSDFNQRNYTRALKHFKDSIAQGNKTAIVRLYLGHTHYALGDKQAAKKVYFDIQCNCFGQPEATMAKSIIEKIDSEEKNGKLSQTESNRPTASARQSGNSPNKQKSLADAIEVLPPLMGHPAVGDDTIRTIRNAIATIPPHVHAILVRGNTTITVAPNIIDKWPDSIDTLKPGKEEVTLAQEGGRTYHRAIHIYERPVIRGSTELGHCRDQSEIRNTFLHEVGHALDNCLSDASTDKAFQQEYKLDLNDMPENFIHSLDYFAGDPKQGPFETFAECVGNLLGMHNDVHSEFEASFRRCKAWVKAKTKL